METVTIISMRCLLWPKWLVMNFSLVGAEQQPAERDNPLPYTMRTHTNFARQKFFSPSGVAQILMDAREFLSAALLAQGI